MILRQFLSRAKERREPCVRGFVCHIRGRAIDGDGTAPPPDQPHLSAGPPGPAAIGSPLACRRSAAPECRAQPVASGSGGQLHRGPALLVVAGAGAQTSMRGALPAGYLRCGRRMAAGPSTTAAQRLGQGLTRTFSGRFQQAPGPRLHSTSPWTLTLRRLPRGSTPTGRWC